MNNDQLGNADNILNHYVELNEDIESAFIGSQEGSIKTAPFMDLTKNFNVAERPWYKEALAANGKAIISDPYISASTNNTVVTIAQAMAGQVNEQFIKAIPIVNPTLPWHLGLITKKKKNPSPAIRAFIDYLAGELPFKR